MAAHQDWNTVTWTKANQRPKGHSKEQEINAARRKGEEIETEKKFLGGQNKSSKHICPNPAAVDEDTGDYRVEKVSHTFSASLRDARQKKKMTQAQLAQAINEKAGVINDYESGKAVPNGQIIQKLNRALGVTLPSAKPKTRPIVV